MGIFDRLKKIFCAKATAEQRTDETTECAAEESVVLSVMQEPAAVKFHPESPVVSFSEKKQPETEKIQPAPAPAVVEQKHTEIDALPDVYKRQIRHWYFLSSLTMAQGDYGTIIAKSRAMYLNPAPEPTAILTVLMDCLLYTSRCV